MQREVSHFNTDNTTFTGAVKSTLTLFKDTVKKHGLNDPRSALMLYHIALLHQTLGKSSQAAAFIQKSYHIFESHFGGGAFCIEEKLRFLGGDCASRRQQHLPSNDASATLVTVDMTAETQQMFNTGQAPDHQYLQALLRWDCTPFPELPDYHYSNIISLVLRTDQVKAFGRLIGKRLIRDERVSTFAGLTRLLKEWKKSLLVPSSNDETLMELNESAFGKTLPLTASRKQSAQEAENHDFLYDASEKLSELFEFIEHTAANGKLDGDTGLNGTAGEFPPAAPPLAQKKQEVTKAKTETHGKEVMIDYFTPETYTETEKPLNAVEELANLVTSRLKSNRLLSLDELINERQQKKLVRKLFNRNEARYRQFVEQINDIADWKTASETLEMFYVKIGVSHYDKMALELSDLVYHRYFPAETDSLSTNKFKW